MSFASSRGSTCVDREGHQYSGASPRDNGQRGGHCYRYPRKPCQDIVYTPAKETSPACVVQTPRKNYQRRPAIAEECKQHSFRFLSSRRLLQAEPSERKLLSEKSSTTFPSNHSHNTAAVGKSIPAQSIEVFPGEYMTLRGADETWRAIQDSFYTFCTCVCCPNLELYCIQDADFVLCPVCKAVSPVDSKAAVSSTERLGKGGIGLGFQSFDLKNWQQEIQAQKQSTARMNFY